MVRAGQRRHHAHQTWSEGRCWNHVGVVGRARFVTARARDRVASPLGHMRAGEQKLEALVAMRVDIGGPWQRAGAALARRREEVDDLVHLLDRE